MKFKRGAALTLFRPTGGKHFTETNTLYCIGRNGVFETGRESIFGEHNTISDQRGLLYFFYWAENCDALI